MGQTSSNSAVASFIAAQDTVELVVLIINRITARALDHRLFCELIEKLITSTEIFFCTVKSDGCPEVRSCCGLLRLEEMRAWLWTKGHEYKEISNPEGFTVDMAGQLDELNMKVKEKLYTAISFFEEFHFSGS
jgi:hypothetical protein